MITNSSFYYTRNLCLDQCYQNTAVTDCGCCDPNTICLSNSIPQCVNDNQTDCIYNSFINYDEIYNTVCSPKCSLECFHNDFNARISFSQLDVNHGIYLYQDIIQNNSNLKSDFISRPINLETTKNSIAFVNIYYESLSYTGISCFLNLKKLSLISLKSTK